MDKRFKIAGIKYISWKHNGISYQAPLRGVKEFGKQFFEADFKDYMEEHDIAPDGVLYTEEIIDAIITRDYGWLREQEIM